MVPAAAVVLLLAAVAAAWNLWPRPVSTQQVRSIAVIPLKNLSGDPSQEYIAEGATEELIRQKEALGVIQALLWQAHLWDADYAGNGSDSE
jgi:hypothetical protein